MERSALHQSFLPAERRDRSGRNGGIVIVALRSIEPGEEITYDYGKEYLEYFLEEGGCRCPHCRRKRAAKRRKQRRAARKRN